MKICRKDAFLLVPRKNQPFYRKQIKNLHFYSYLRSDMHENYKQIVLRQKHKKTF